MSQMHTTNEGRPPLMETPWITVGFIPADTSLVAHELRSPDEGVATLRAVVVGWLIQHRYDADSDRAVPTESRIIAASLDWQSAEIEPVSSGTRFVGLFPPGQEPDEHDLAPVRMGWAKHLESIQRPAR